MSRGRPFTAAEHDRIDEMLRDGESLSAGARFAAGLIAVGVLAVLLALGWLITGVAAR